jgi:hypothetical protein
VFLRELVNRRAVAAAANWAYNERYRVVPIVADLTLENDQIAPGGCMRYAWRLQGRTHHVAARCFGNWCELDPQSHAAFIAEHYYGYGTARDGRTIEYRVEHPPWRWAEVRKVEVNIDAAQAYGRQFSEIFHSQPYSAFLLDCSPVTVFWPSYFRPERTSRGVLASGSFNRAFEPRVSA